MSHQEIAQYATVFVVALVILIIVALVTADYMATKALPSIPNDALEDQLATLDQINEHLNLLYQGLHPEHKGEYAVNQEDLINLGDLVEQASDINRSIRGVS